MRPAIVLALLSALWQGPGRAVVTWEGSGCLYRNQTLIVCVPREQASYTLELGGAGPLDAKFQPQAGDVYTLIRPDGGHETTRLMGRVFVAWVGR